MASSGPLSRCSHLTLVSLLRRNAEGDALFSGLFSPNTSPHLHFLQDQSLAAHSNFDEATPQFKEEPGHALGHYGDSGGLISADSMGGMPTLSLSSHDSSFMPYSAAAAQQGGAGGFGGERSLAPEPSEADVRALFGLPLAEAAEKLCMCLSSFKKLCRRVRRRQGPCLPPAPLLGEPRGRSVSDAPAAFLPIAAASRLFCRGPPAECPRARKKGLPALRRRRACRRRRIFRAGRARRSQGADSAAVPLRIVCGRRRASGANSAPMPTVFAPGGLSLSPAHACPPGAATRRGRAAPAHRGGSLRFDGGMRPAAARLAARPSQGRAARPVA